MGDAEEGLPFLPNRWHPYCSTTGFLTSRPGAAGGAPKEEAWHVCARLQTSIQLAQNVVAPQRLLSTRPHPPRIPTQPTTMPGSWRPTPQNHQRSPSPCTLRAPPNTRHVAFATTFTLQRRCHHHVAPHTASRSPQRPTNLRHLHRHLPSEELLAESSSLEKYDTRTC